MLGMGFRAISVLLAVRAPIQPAVPLPAALAILDHGLLLWLGSAPIAMPVHGLLLLEPHKPPSAMVAMQVSIQR